jgi:hypothetical protein
MSDEKFRRIKKRLENELKTTLTTSFWVALAVAFLALGASLIVSIESAELKPQTTSKLEGYDVGCFALAGVLLLVHVVTNKSAKKRAADFMDELETDLYKVPAPVSALVPGAGPATKQLI